jgi:hypothetical protein
MFDLILDSDQTPVPIMRGVLAVKSLILWLGGAQGNQLKRDLLLPIPEEWMSNPPDTGNAE